MSVEVSLASAVERMVEAQARGFELLRLAIDTEGAELHEGAARTERLPS